MRASKRLVNYLNEIDSYINNYKTEKESVSSSTVGWQIDHALKVINRVFETLQEAPTNKSPKLTKLGKFCLFTRYIPRGRGKAPKIVLPPKDIKEQGLRDQLSRAKKYIEDVSDINAKATFKHQYFGVLNKKQTIKFVEVHTKHHLKIVRDILK